MQGSAVSRRRSSPPPPTSPGTCNQLPRGHCAMKESKLFIRQKMSLAAGRTDKAPAALTGNLDCVVLIATGSQAGSPARRGLAMDRRATDDDTNSQTSSCERRSNARRAPSDWNVSNIMDEIGVISASPISSGSGSSNSSSSR